MRLIDADALRWSIYYDTRYGTYRECMDGSEVAFTSKEVYALIDDANTIEAEPVRHGRWIDVYGGRYANAKYICSCCGKRAHSDDWKWELSDFCPNCGAKMDGDSHDQA